MVTHTQKRPVFIAYTGYHLFTFCDRTVGWPVKRTQLLPLHPVKFLILFGREERFMRVKGFNLQKPVVTILILPDKCKAVWRRSSPAGNPFLPLYVCGLHSPDASCYFQWGSLGTARKTPGDPLPALSSQLSMDLPPGLLSTPRNYNVCGK